MACKERKWRERRVFLIPEFWKIFAGIVKWVLKRWGRGDLSQMGLWAPLTPKLVMVKTLIYGPRTKSTKKTKLIAEKSSIV